MNSRLLLGIDIGGTTVKLGLVRCGDNPRIERRSVMPTLADRPAADIAARIIAAARTLIGPDSIEGIGLCAPGIVKPAEGTVNFAANLPTLHRFALRDTVGAALGVPSAIQNDANAAALGEYYFGADRGTRNLILVTLGTGVGGGVICDGRLLQGADNAAAELGHVKVDRDVPCSCGKRGCVEAYAGLAGIRRIADALLAQGVPTTVAARPFQTADLAAAAAAGDALALRTFDAVGQKLGEAFANFIDTFNPELILIGGGASGAFDYMAPAITRTIDERCSITISRQRAAVRRSRTADDIAILGAAAVFLTTREA